MKISHRLILLLAICLYVDLLTYGQDWQYLLNKRGDHTAQISADGHTPDGIIKTTFIIQHGCRPNKDFQLNYIIREAREMKNFNFSDFGPYDAPSNKTKLMTIKMRFKSVYETLKIGVTGWYQQDPDAVDKSVFVFSRLEYIGFEYKFGDQLFRLVKALQKNPLSISVSVQSYSDRSKVIHTEFPVAGLSTALTKILRGCDKSVRRL